MPAGHGRGRALGWDEVLKPISCSVQVFPSGSANVAKLA